MGAAGQSRQGCTTTGQVCAPNGWMWKVASVSSTGAGPAPLQTEDNSAKLKDLSPGEPASSGCGLPHLTEVFAWKIGVQG